MNSKVRLCQDCYQEISKKLKENGDLVEDKNGVNFNEE